MSGDTQKTFDQRELLELLMQGANRAGTPTIVRLRDGGQVWVFAQLAGVDSVGERPVRVEDSGELAHVNYGKTSAGVVRPVRLNATDQLFSELYENWNHVAPVELTGVDANLYVPGAGASDLFLVELEVYNIVGVAAVVTLYVDVGGGGVPANNEYVMNAESLPSKNRLSFVRVIKGNDTIRGFTTAGNDANVHFQVRQVART